MSNLLTEMSDEDIQNMDVDSFQPPVETQEDSDDTKDDAGTESPPSTETTLEGDVTPDESEGDQEEESGDGEITSGDTLSTTTTDEDGDGEESDDDAGTGEDNGDDNSSSDSDDPLTKLINNGIPFNGTTINVQSLDELVTLAQRGLGSNRRIQAMKPELQMMATLKQHGITSEQDISLLVEASQGKPEALKALMVKNKVDYLDLGEVEGEDYKPEDKMISASAYKLTEVEASIQDFKTYADTISKVNKFENSDLTMIRTDPALLGMLAEHNESGDYEYISNIVTGEQAKGEMSGKTFLEAYSAVAEILSEHLAGNSGKSEAGHNENSQRKQSNNGSNSSPHENQQNANSGQKGSSGKGSGSGKGTSQKAAKAASEASRSGGKPSKNETGVIDVSKLSDDDIANFDMSQFD